MIQSEKKQEFQIIKKIKQNKSFKRACISILISEIRMIMKEK